MTESNLYYLALLIHGMAYDDNEADGDATITAL
jgi:hypothetical protein